MGLITPIRFGEGLRDGSMNVFIVAHAISISVMLAIVIIMNNNYAKVVIKGGLQCVPLVKERNTRFVENVVNLARCRAKYGILSEGKKRWMLNPLKHQEQK